MAALPPDYDTDPARWRSWKADFDIHHLVAPWLRGPVLDIGCGDGRLAGLVPGGVSWVGLDASPTQLRDNRHRPVVLGDMRTLPFTDGTFAEALHLWCLYHVDDPATAIAEAARVLRPGGRYFAATSARDNDPELVPDGYAPTSFDAEDAMDIAAQVFPRVQATRWDQRLVELHTRAEVRAYCRHHAIPAARAEQVDLPVRLTKRGLLLTASNR